MRRRALILGFAAPLVGTAHAQSTAGEATAEALAPPLPALGTALTVPELTLLDGRRFGPVDAEGRVLVIYWWASWCPFCALQTPHVERLWRAHQPQGLRVLGLSTDRSAEAATRYLAQRGYSFPSAWVTPALQQVLPKPKGLPVTVVRGRDGRVRAAEAGQLFPEDIEQFARFL